MTVETGIVSSSEAKDLFFRDCRPDNGVVHGTLIWVHGLGEHGGRYDHVAAAMTQLGWRVIFGDLRGHGQSAGTRTHVRSFDDYVADVTRIWNRFDLGTGRTVLGGHSMGGLVAVRAVQKGTVRPSALVLTSPLLRVKLRINPLKRWLGQLLVGFLPTARFNNGLDARNMTYDPEFARLRREDPFIIRTVTAGWFFAMEAAIAEAHREASKIAIPILALRGLADETTDGDVVSSWLAQTSAPVSELISLPEHVHELLHESDWRATLTRILDWLERTGAAGV